MSNPQPNTQQRHAMETMETETFTQSKITGYRQLTDEEAELINEHERRRS